MEPRMYFSIFVCILTATDVDFQQQNSNSVLLMPSNENSITRTRTRTGTHEPQGDRTGEVSCAERCVCGFYLQAAQKQQASCPTELQQPEAQHLGCFLITETPHSSS